MSSNLIAFAGGTREDRVLAGSCQEVVERYKGEEVGKGDEEEDDGFSTERKVEREPLE